MFTLYRDIVNLSTHSLHENYVQSICAFFYISFVTQYTAMAETKSVVKSTSYSEISYILSVRK